MNKKPSNNELKQRLINSNLININNVLGKPQFYEDNNFSKESSQNSIFSGTPLNKIQANSANKFNFNNKF